MSALRDDLARLQPPDADAAQARGWQVAAAAFETRTPQVVPRRRRRAASIGVAVAVAATALSPAGAAVADWLSRTVDPPAPAPRAALTSLPASGNLLALAGQDLWIVHADGSRRRLGTYEDAVFSPQARFVAATRGTRLAALDPRGAIRWSLDRDGGVGDPRWAPSGLRVAYRAGNALRVVYGDGNLDRAVASHVARVAPAWRPGPAHLLSWVDPKGRVTTQDTDRDLRLWRSRPGAIPWALSWSRDGARLLVVRPRSVVEFDAGGRIVDRLPVAGVTAVAWLPDSSGYVTAGDGRVILRRKGADLVLLDGPGAIDAIAISPDGHWVLLGWPGAGQWLFVRTDGRGTPRVAPAIARDFTPGAGALAPFPRPLGWR